MFFNDPYDPQNPVDWRWQLAGWLRSNNKYARKSKYNTDDFIPTIKAFQTARAAATTEEDQYKLRHKFPGLFWADRIRHSEKNDTRWQIEARILAQEDFDTIAKKCRTHKDVVTWYEITFFDVLRHIRDTGYIASVVMADSMKNGLKDRDYDLLWKIVGYALGPVALEAMILPLEQNIVEDAKDMGPHLQQSMRQIAQLKAWVAWKTIPTAYNQFNVVSLWNEMVNIERQAGDTEKSQTQMVQSVQQALLAFRYGAQVAAGGEGGYDGGAVEPRAHEQLAAAVGRKPARLLEMKGLKFPEKETTNASHVQGNPG